MKQIYFYLACLLASTAARANGNHPFPGGRSTHDGGVQFQFSNIAPGKEHKDSMLIIFDRANHTGAGIIYDVFAADKDHCVTIPAIPAGKYYVTIQCLGSHRDRMEKLIRIKSKKNGKIRIDLENSELFSKDKVVIPAWQPDFAHLSVLKSK